MIKRISLRLFKALMVAMLLFSAVANVIPQYAYAGTSVDNHVIPFTVTDTSGTSRTNVPVIISYDVQGNLIDYSYINATATDTYIDSSGSGNSPVGSGTAYDFMMASSNITAVIPSLPAYGTVTLNLYTEYSPEQTSFPIIVGNGGKLTITEDSSMEIGSDGSVELTDAYIDTTESANITRKDYALNVGTNGTAITASVRVGQPIVGGTSDALNGGAATEYNGIMGGNVWNATEANVLQVVPTVGQFRDLYIETSAALAGGSTATFTVMKNGVATSLSDALAAGESTGSNTTYGLTVAAGDTISLRCVTTGAVGAIYARWSFTFIPETYGETIFMADDVTASGGTRYGFVQGGDAVNASEAIVQAPIPCDGTFSDMYVVLSASPGAAPDAYSFTLRDAGADSTLTTTITDPATTGSDTTHTVAVTAGDLIDIEITPLNAPASSPYYAVGMVFTPDTEGEYVVMGGSVDNLNPAATEYNFLCPANSGLWTGTEANVYSLTQQTIYKSLYAHLAAAPGAGKSYQFDLRAEGADSGLTVTIADAAQAGNDTTHAYTTGNGDTVGMEATPAGTPAATYGTWGVVAYRVDVELSRTETAGEHDVVFSSDGVFKSLQTDGDMPPVADDLVMNAPLPQPECYAAPGGTFQTIDSNGLTVTNTGVDWTLDKGYEFGGNGSGDKLDINDGGLLDFTTEDFSIGFWVDANTFATDSVFFSRGTYEVDGYYCYTPGGSGLIYFITSQAGIHQNAAVCPVPTTGTPHYIEVVRDGTIGYIYIDAVESVTYRESIVNPLTSANHFYIGQYSGGGSELNGVMGDLMVWETAHTTDQVLQNFNATKNKYLGTGDIDTYSSLATVPDNSEDWVIENFSYMTSFDEYVGGVNKCNIDVSALVTSDTIPDDTTYGNDATINWGTNTGMTITGKSLVDSGSATSVGTTSFLMQGELVDIGTYASVYLSFEYGLNTDYGYYTTETSAATAQTHSVTLTGLTPNTTYHYRAIARSGSVYTYGEDITVTTFFSTSSEGSTTPLIISKAIFNDYITTGDHLVCAEIVVTYPPYYPTGIPSEYFQLQLIGDDGTTILGATPLKQWGDRPSAIYFAPTANITDYSDYAIRITNISSANITNTSESFEDIEWKGDDLTRLDDWCIGAAISMQNTDGTVLTDPYVQAVIDVGLILTDTAGGFFTIGIPNIAQVRPNLFNTAEYLYSIDTRSGDVDYNAGSTLTDRVGANVVADFTTVGDIFNLSGQQTLFYMILGTILLFIVYVVSQTNGFGALGALCLSVPVVGASVYFNIMEIVLPVVVAVFFIYMFARKFWQA